MLDVKALLTKVLNSIKNTETIEGTYGRLSTMSSAMSLATTAKKLPLTSFSGSGCSLSSNGIKVTRAGHYVISGIVYWGDGFTALDVVHAYLYVNSTSYCECQTRINTQNYYATTTVGPLVTYLNANDVVYLYALNQGGNRGYVSNRTGSGISLWRLD